MNLPRENDSLQPYTNLHNWGLSEHFEQEARLHGGLWPARVTEQHRNLYKIICEHGFMQAAVSGKFMYAANASAGDGTAP
jgi:ribosome biogenesis GTPase